MSAIFSDGEESLGTGLDRQVNRLSDLEDVITHLKRDLPSLRRQCERFKTERASLQTEIASLRSERDTLRLEVSSSYDRTTYLTELSVSGELDGQGKLNRKIWALEQKNETLHREFEAKGAKYQQELERERNVSSGLRDRIGTLDEKRRKLQKGLEEAEGREKGLKGELEALRHSSRADVASLQAELEAMRGGTKMSSSAVNRASQECPEIAVVSPRRALQKKPSNIIQATPMQIPATPTKSQTTPLRKRAASLSPASLAKRCALLEDRHTLLKGEYDKLRSKYQDDIKHWKEWKAADSARKEDKKKRKERKKTTATPGEEGPPVSANAVGLETVTLVPPSQKQANASQDVVASQSGSQRVTRSQARKRKADEDEQSSPPRDQQLPAPVSPIPSNIDSRDVKNGGHDSVWVNEIAPPPPSQKRRITRRVSPPLPLLAPRLRSETPTPIAQVDKTPTGRLTGSETRRRPTPAARVTPWLGASTKPLSRTSSKPMLADPDIDPFNDEHDSPVKLGTTANSLVPGNKTPLVRDRGGAGVDGPASSLRRTLLARNMSTDVHTSGGDRSRDSISPGPGLGESSKKRGLDMSDLSPDQIAQERKRLSKMTPAEKKVAYAEYKGKGRYIRPEEVLSKVTDEYEIDPKLNNGLKYQYHDVQRGRAERRLMHGGECECCNGYYEAVGPLPRYNTGPAWKDVEPRERLDPAHDGDEMGMTEAQIKEHQNQVSRHRETWVRPPTPPGYWQIGFPNTQDVEEQNRKADAMVAKKEAEIRREAAHKDSKWKKKT